MHSGLFTGNKKGGGAVRLGLRFEGQNYHYFKTLVFCEALQYRRNLIQLGSNQVYRVGRMARVDNKVCTTTQSL